MGRVSEKIDFATIRLLFVAVGRRGRNARVESAGSRFHTPNRRL